MIKPKNTICKKRQEKGSIYFLALASAIVLVALVLSMATNILQFRRVSMQNSAGAEARIYAELGIKNGVRFTIADSDWRNHLSSGTWTPGITIDETTYSLSGVDPVDNDLSDNMNDPVVFTCTATYNGTSRTVSVETQNAPSKLLNYAIATQNDIFIQDNVIINGNITANDDINKYSTSSLVDGDAEAADTIGTETNITGTITEHDAPKTFFDDSTFWNWLYNNQTVVPFNYYVEKDLITPDNGPVNNFYTNSYGVYAIYCAGRRIVIRNCRIIGTLVIYNPRSDSIIETSMNWQPAVPGMPSLVVYDGDMTMSTYTTLNESSLFFDFNLPGESGYGSKSATFPNMISGTIYMKYGELTIEDSTKITGTIIIDGDISIRQNAQITWDPSVLENPTIFMRESYLMFNRGTWKETF